VRNRGLFCCGDKTDIYLIFNFEKKRKLIKRIEKKIAMYLFHLNIKTKKGKLKCNELVASIF
jgi:DNA repair photolyase